MERILVVDDEDKIRAIIRKYGEFEDVYKRQQIDRIFKIKSIVTEIKQNDDFFMRENIFVWIDIVNGYDGVRKSLGCFLIS